MIKRILLVDSVAISYVLYNNFSYTQVASAFIPQKDFDIFLGPFFAFYLFLLQKDFNIFACFFSASFFIAQ